MIVYELNNINNSRINLKHNFKFYCFVMVIKNSRIRSNCDFQKKKSLKLQPWMMI